MGLTVDTVPITELLDERQHLLNVAQWLLGTATAAEEAVTETYRRWFRLTDAQRTGMTDPRPWLTKSAGTICLSRLSVSEHRPLGAGRPGGAAPAEQTPHLGHEPPDQIRRILRSDHAFPAASRRHDRIVRAVHRTCASADILQLASLLAPEATAFFDGGGKIRTLSRPVHGNHRVARALLVLLAPLPRITLHLHSTNGRTAIVVRCGEQVAAVISFSICDDHVTHVWAVLNPDKLRGWNRPRPPLTGRE